MCIYFLLKCIDAIEVGNMYPGDSFLSLRSLQIRHELIAILEEVFSEFFMPFINLRLFLNSLMQKLNPHLTFLWPSISFQTSPIPQKCYGVEFTLLIVCSACLFPHYFLFFYFFIFLFLISIKIFNSIQFNSTFISDHKIQ